MAKFSDEELLDAYCRCSGQYDSDKEGCFTCPFLGYPAGRCCWEALICALGDRLEELIKERKERDPAGLVRCQDCKYREAYDGDNGMHSDWWCRSLQTFVEEDFYCKDGKRKVDKQQ